jgi:serine/threonine protein kinase
MTAPVAASNLEVSVMERICPYCMQILSEEKTCPSCGKDPGAYRPSSHHFPPGTQLHDRYLLGRVLGEGGFGITYLGLDTELERRVAVKEYFPTAFVKRETSLTLEVTCYTDAGRASYEKGREQFLKEARTMARLENIPEIVRVLDFFQANNTAYIVMEFLEGETLKDRTVRLGRIPAGELLELLRPVMEAMDSMHRAGIIHRDISPDNLMCLSDGRVKLMDFGCAKDIGGGRTMTVTLKQGFAPLEQYTGHGQGTWSDLYSLCTTIYYCLTGRVPPAALERDKDQDRELDPLLPPNQLGANLTSRQEWALIKGMALRVQDRWQTIRDLYGALYGVNLDGTVWKEPSEQKGRTEGKTEYVKNEESRFFGDAQIEDKVPPTPEKKKRISKRTFGIVAACCALAVVTAAALGSGLLSGSENSVDRSGSSVILSGEEGDTSDSLAEEDLLSQDEAQSAGGRLPSFSEDAQEQEGEGEEPEEGDPTADEGNTGPADTTPTAKPTQQQNQPAQQTTPPVQTESEKTTAPTKAELESQAKTAAAEGRYSNAADLYRQMKELGYISGSKLAVCLTEVAGDAESDWYDTAYGDNSSPLIKTAYDLYVEAADMGNKEAMAAVAYCYDYGHYVNQDSAKACQWWTKLANTGDGPACYFVAQYYADGNGVPQNTQTAIEWLNKCLEYGAGYVESDAQALLHKLQGG